MKTIAPEPRPKRSKTLDVNDNGEIDSDGNNPIQIKQNIAKIVAKQQQPACDLPFF
jgi:hypothetical protein